MEKISGIVPSSARTKAVDLRDAPPIRPGAPGFGRPEGVSSLREARIGETAARAAEISRDHLSWRTKDQKQAAMAREISERFFRKATAPAAQEVVVDQDFNYRLDQSRASKPAGFKMDRLEEFQRTQMEGGLNPEAMEDIMPPAILMPASTTDFSEPLAVRAEQVSAEVAEPTSPALVPKGTYLNVSA
ncbi:MAG TPA: hypothetical protein PLZ57_05115 [Pseudobdellovibrionaceae bacterium]|nr:hypothetical protein [Pseudobdellovibrionaceae bacterium]